MLLLLQIALSIWILLNRVDAKPPPGYEKPPEEPDKSPPKYEYGYSIDNLEDGVRQGKLESRDGEQAVGRYYVQGDTSSQKVEYVANDFGFQTFVRYSNKDPHSQSQAHFALGEEAVNALRNDNQSVPVNTSFVESLQTKPSEEIKTQTSTQSDHLTTENQGNYITENPGYFYGRGTEINQYFYESEEQTSTSGAEDDGLSSDEKPDASAEQVESEQQYVHEITETSTKRNENSETDKDQGDGVKAEDLADSKGSNEIANKINEALTDLKYLGEFGVKLNPKISPQQGQTKPSKLIETTKHLISGQDVLNINGAIANSAENNSVEATEGAFGSDFSFVQYAAATPLPSFLITDRSSNGENEEISLSKQPIVVPDYEDDSEEAAAASEQVEETQNQEKVVSSTQISLDTPVAVDNFDAKDPETVLVTPRPSTNDAQNEENSQSELNYEEGAIEQQKQQQQNTYVEVQQSLPYYLGKFEYPTHLSYESGKKEDDQGNLKFESAVQNFELGKSLIDFPVAGFSEEIQHHQLQSLVNVQQLPSPQVNQKFNEHDQVQEQGEQINVSTEIPSAAPLVQEQNLETYSAEVPVPHQLEKPTLAPQPRPVKGVENPVRAEFAEYIERPYTLHIPERQPYAVETVAQEVIQLPYQNGVHVQFQVPSSVVEKKVPVPHYVEKSVEKAVEKPVPQYIEKPYPVEVKVPFPVPQAYYVPVEVPKPYPVQVTKYIAKPYPVPQPYPVKVTETVGVPVAQPVPYEVRVPHMVPVEVPKYIEKIVERPYPVYITKGQHGQKHNQLFYLSQNNCDQQKSHSNHYYIGLVPPPKFQEQPQFRQQQQSRKMRNPRSNFNHNLRLEYGFMPPLIPSLQIDEYGNPIEKDEN